MKELLIWDIENVSFKFLKDIENIIKIFPKKTYIVSKQKLNIYSTKIIEKYNFKFFDAKNFETADDMIIKIMKLSLINIGKITIVSSDSDFLNFVSKNVSENLKFHLIMDNNNKHGIIMKSNITNPNIKYSVFGNKFFKPKKNKRKINKINHKKVGIPLSKKIKESNKISKPKINNKKKFGGKNIKKKDLWNKDKVYIVNNNLKTNKSKDISNNKSNDFKREKLNTLALNEDKTKNEILNSLHISLPIEKEVKPIKYEEIDLNLIDLKNKQYVKINKEKKFITFEEWVILEKERILKKRNEEFDEIGVCDICKNINVKIKNTGSFKIKSCEKCEKEWIMFSKNMNFEKGITRQMKYYEYFIFKEVETRINGFFKYDFNINFNIIDNELNKKFIPLLFLKK